MARSSLEIRFVTRLTEAQAKQLDEYAARHGHHTKAAAIRDLVVKGVRYDRWQEGRRVRNLPPFPRSRLPQYEPPSPEYAVDISDRFREKYGVVSDETMARYIAGSRSELRSFRTKVLGVIRRAKRQQEHKQLEEDMNKDLESHEAIR